jgi:phosphoglycerate dehydrogenase-like enzyme
MQVHAYTNRPRPTPESRKHEHTYTVPGLGDPEGVFPKKWFSGSNENSLNEFLSSELDLLVLSAPLTHETKQIISAPQLKLLSRKKTFVSNIGRGGLVNTMDLVQALNEGWIRGAALDVTDPEPLPEGHPLWKAKNVIVTPHVSWASKSYNSRIMEIIELNLRRISEGQEIVNRVNTLQVR